MKMIKQNKFFQLITLLRWLTYHLFIFICSSEWQQYQKQNMLRSSTSHSGRDRTKLPLRQTQIDKRKANIISRNRARQKIHQPQSQKVLHRYQSSKTPFRETGTTLGRGFSHRIRSSNYFHEQMNNYTETCEMRPITTQKNSRASPLRLLSRKKQYTDFDQISEEIRSRSEAEIKRKFLRKGTAINRSILLNILKKKSNASVIDTSASYSNFPGNQALIAAIKKQLPKGLRDTIGCEQTMRMSNIFTGGNLKSMNLHWKANLLVKNYCEKPAPLEEQQEITMKSIKRW